MAGERKTGAGSMLSGVLERAPQPRPEPAVEPVHTALQAIHTGFQAVHAGFHGGEAGFHARIMGTASGRCNIQGALALA